MLPHEQDLLQNSIQDFLNSNKFTIHELAGDASSRRYFRVIKDENSWVLMKWEPFDPHTYPFLSVIRLLSEVHCRVPRIEYIDGLRGILILEDLGDLTLERKYWEALDPKVSLHFYEQAIEELVKIHHQTKASQQLQSTAFTTVFDKAKFLWEMNYAYENLVLKYLNYLPSSTEHKAAQNEFSTICETLSAEPKVVCHRDYHSRNIMIKLGQVRVIDFQDARMGPVPYDLVSLLLDSYVNIPEDMQRHLKEHYFALAAPFWKPSPMFDTIWNLQVIQRCFKACGTFSAIYNQRNDKRYLRYLPQTLQIVFEALLKHNPKSSLAGILKSSSALTTTYE